jgi:uridine kinase
MSCGKEKARPDHDHSLWFDGLTDPSSYAHPEPAQVTEQNAQVILIAGPSGSGKSYIARRTGLPILCLDDFYKNGDDPTLPRISGTIDWESPESWDAKSAIAAIEQLAVAGRVEVPAYSFSANQPIGTHVVTTGGSPLFIGEGIFAAEIAAECLERGLLAGAFTVRRPRLVTFARRLTRDLAEHRKPPMVLVRRGLRLLRSDPRVLARQADLGCRPASAREIRRAASRMPA